MNRPYSITPRTQANPTGLREAVSFKIGYHNWRGKMGKQNRELSLAVILGYTLFTEKHS